LWHLNRFLHLRLASTSWSNQEKQTSKTKKNDMSIERLLENWNEYDNKKIRDGRDGRFFACSESWEVDYLVKKFKAVYPHLAEAAIRAAISQCCTDLRAPQPRNQFVECVRRRLSV
jgi:hypothetical protein